MNKILAMIFMACAVCAAQAQDYYIDANNGSDYWNGTSTSCAGCDPLTSNPGPWRTIAKVNEFNFQPGDSVLFQCGGMWRETLTISRSGAAGSPITFGAQTGCGTTNKPTISGAQVVTEWTAATPEGIYSAVVDQPVQAVFVDGQYIPRAHYPDKAPTDPSSSAFLDIAANSNAFDPDNNIYGANYLTISAGDALYLGDKDLVGADIHIRSVEWAIEDNTITSLTSSTFNLGSVTTYPIKKDWGYYLEGKFWMLSPGEWFWNETAGNGLAANTLYVWLLPGNYSNLDPNDRSIEASIRASGITATQSVQNIVVTGLAIEKAGKNAIDLRSAGGFTISNLDIADSGDSGIYVFNNAWDANYPEDDADCTLISGIPGSINNNTVRNSRRQGIKLRQIADVSVTGNKITNTDTFGSPLDSRGAISAGYITPRTTISANAITNSGYNGITFGRCTTVEKNVVRNSCVTLSDCGAIYTFNGLTTYYFTNETPIKPIPPVLSTVANNIVDGVMGGVDGTPRVSASETGIYLDNFSNSIEVSGNTVINAGAGLHTNNPFGNNIHGNTFYGAGLNMVEGYGVPFGTVQGLYGSTTPPMLNTVSNNILFPLDSRPSLTFTNIPDKADIFGVTDIFGAFSDNTYSSLYGDTLARESYTSASYPNNTVDKLPPITLPYHMEFTLPGWQAQRSQDAGSRNSPLFSIAPFRIDMATMGANLVPTGSFDSNTCPVAPLPPSCQYRSLSSGTPTNAIWRMESDCDESTSGGCLEFIPFDTSVLSVYPASTLLDGYGASFGLEKDATYLVQFKLKSRLDHQNLLLRMIGVFYYYDDSGQRLQDWRDVGITNTENPMGYASGQFIDAGPEWREYAYIFTASEDSPKTKVDFTTIFVHGTGSILIDNISVRKVTGEFNDPSDDSKILVNDTSTPRPATCPDILPNGDPSPRCLEYVDLDGQQVDWNAPLAAFTSKIIVWAYNPLKDTDRDIYSDNIDNCDLIPNPDQADSNQNGIGNACETNLTVSKTGNGAGTIASSPAGINCGTDCAEPYEVNMSVALTATPDATSVFAGWNGPDGAECNTGSVAMTAAKSCTATFALKTYTLTLVKVGNGTGTVTGAGTYDYGSPTAVTATASTGSTFTGWSGTDGTECTTGSVAVTADKSCTATFTLNTYTLTLAKVGNGSGTVTGAGTYNYGSPATVTATASTGSTFTGWSGTDGAECTTGSVAVTADKSCAATFTLKTYILTLAKAGNGTGTVTGAGTYDYGSPATVTATASTGSTFAGWSGTDGTECTTGSVAVTADKSCTATFTINTYTLTLAKAGNGAGTVAGAGTYNYGTNATVTAIADTGSSFIGWSGTNSAECATGTVGMTADKSCTATFTSYKNPTANVAQAKSTGGDGNGYQTNPTNAYADDNLLAVDSDSGTNTSTSCTDNGKDKHRYYNYGLGIPAGSSIKGIEVKLKAKADATTGSPKICVQVSWNGGTTWNSVAKSVALTTTLNSYTLGGAADTWGRAWAVNELNDANFMVRVTDVASDRRRDFSLDSVQVRVTY